eukprot:15466742-Alexandrium_andersonii.AAC.1
MAEAILDEWATVSHSSPQVKNRSLAAAQGRRQATGAAMNPGDSEHAHTTKAAHDSDGNRGAQAEHQ